MEKILKKVLIADDEKDMVEILAEQLERKYKVIKSYNTLQALSKIHQNKPDLIILDIVMSPGSGFSLFEHMQMSNEMGHIPVIFITGHSIEENQIKALDVGGIDFIPKPIKMQEFKDKVERILG